MDPQIIETILNLVYFLVGLTVGIFGLWQNQKYFQAQQQDKFDQISVELREIRERLTVMAEATSERAFARENRLLSLAMQQAVVDTATEEATADIQTMLVEELQRAGISDAMQRVAKLEEKVSKIVAKSAEQIVEAHQDAELYAELLSLPDFHREMLRTLGEQPFTARQLKTRFAGAYSDSAFYRILARWREAGIVERSERGIYTVRPGVQQILAEIRE